MHSVDAEARQKAVKITVTGVELDRIERDFTDARERAKRYSDSCKDGAGSLADLSRAVHAYYEAAAAAKHLYYLNGSAEWNSKANVAQSGGQQAHYALLAREREIGKRLDGFTAQLAQVTADLTEQAHHTVEVTNAVANDAAREAADNATLTQIGAG